MNDVLPPAPAVALRRLGTGAVTVSVLLGLVSMAAVLGDDALSELRSYLDVGEEANLPTWWSTVLLLAAALAHALAGLAARTAAPANQAPAHRAWFAGAAVLAALSLTEHTGLHNRLDGVGRQLIGESALTADWLPLGAIAGLGVLVTFTVVALRLGGRAAHLLRIGVPVLLGGALGGELAGRLLPGHGTPEWAYVLAYHLGELGENVGAALLLAAALSALTLTREQRVLRLRYRPAPTVERGTALEPGTRT